MTKVQAAIDAEERRLSFYVRTLVNSELQTSCANCLMREWRRLFLLPSKREKPSSRRAMMISTHSVACVETLEIVRTIDVDRRLGHWNHRHKFKLLSNPRSCAAIALQSEQIINVLAANHDGHTRRFIVTAGDDTV